jgi:putative ABC transport system permease protein
MNFSWTTAFKIAWREARSSSFKFLFVILAVAIGVGSLTGVRGFSHAFNEMLLGRARSWRPTYRCVCSNCQRQNRIE